jgi:hypothetical protein
MSRADKTLRVAVWLSVAAQLLFGGVGFLAFPEAVFPDIKHTPLAELGLRLAAYSNLSQGIVAVYLLTSASSAAPIRVLSGALSVYHVLAGLDGARAAAGLLPVSLAAPVFGPVVFHSVSAIALGLAVACSLKAAPPNSSPTVDPGVSKS